MMDRHSLLRDIDRTRKKFWGPIMGLPITGMCTQERADSHVNKWRITVWLEIRFVYFKWSINRQIETSRTHKPKNIEKLFL